MNRRWLPRRLVGLVAVVCSVVVGLTACGADGNDRLDVLREDPLVTLPVEGVASERYSERAGSDGGIMGPFPSSARRTFILESGPIQPTLDRLAAAAREHGWTVTPLDHLGYSGFKDIDGLYAQLLITGVEAEQTVWFQILASV